MAVAADVVVVAFVVAIAKGDPSAVRGRPREEGRGGGVSAFLFGMAIYDERIPLPQSFVASATTFDRSNQLGREIPRLKSAVTQARPD